MTQVTKDQFFSALKVEKKDIIHGECYQHGNTYYPRTTEFKPRYGGDLFGKVIDFGYINGLPTSEYYLNKT